MNKVYKVIWSKVRNCYVVVSELAKRNGKNTATTDKRRKLTAGLAMATMAVVLNTSVVGNAEAYATMVPTGSTPTQTNNPHVHDTSIAAGGTTASDRPRVYTPNSIGIGNGQAGITRSSAAGAKDTVDKGGNSIAIGNNARNFTYGYSNTDDYYANSRNSISIGHYAHTHAANAFAIGTSTDATAERSFAIGTTSTNEDRPHRGAHAGGQGSLAFGDQAVVGTEIPANKSEPERRGSETAVNDAIAVGTNTIAKARNAVVVGGGMSYTYHDGAGTSNMTNVTKYWNGSGWVDEAEGTGANVGFGADGGVAIGGATGTVTGEQGNTYFPVGEPTGVDGYTAAATVGNYATRAVAIGSGAVVGDGAVNSVAVGARNIVSGVNSTAVGSGDDTSANKVSAYASGSFGNKNLVGKQQVDANGNLLPDPTTTDVFVVGGNNEIANDSGNATFIGVFGSSNEVKGSDSTNSTIIGNSNVVTNKLTNSLVAGNSNTGLNTVDNSQIIGNTNNIGAKVSNLVVLGNNTTATGGINSAIAIGERTTIGANSAMALGRESTASGITSIAAGYQAQATERSAMALGRESTASGISSIAAGYKAQATAHRSLALGRESVASVNEAVALGSSSVAARDKANGGAGAGYDVTTGTYYAGSDKTSPTWTSTLAAVSVGGDSSNAAIGQAATATRQITGVAAGTADTDAVNVAQLKRVGEASKITTDNRNVGLVTNAEGRQEITSPYIHVEGVGKATEKYNADLAAYLASSEYTSLSDADKPAALEAKIAELRTTYGFASATGNYSSAFGRESTASGVTSLAAGYKAQATGDSSMALGRESSAEGITSIAAGYKAVAKGDSSMALGRESNAEGITSIAAGYKAQATAHRSLALGRETVASVNEAVALGSSSVAARDKANGGVGAGYDAATGTYYAGSDNTSPTWTSTLAAVSIGGDSSNAAIGQAATATRQLTGLAAGTADTDAVNVAQLKRLGEAAKISSDNRNVGLITNAEGRQEITSPYIHVEGVDGAMHNYNADLAAYLASSEYTSLSDADKPAALEAKIAELRTTYGFASATGNSSMALGRESKAEGITSIAAGYKAVAKGDSSMALGRESSAEGITSIAAGYQAIASGISSIAAGYKAQATGHRSLAFGLWAVASVNEAVALGSSSVAARDKANGGAGAGYDVLTGTNYAGTGAASATWTSTMAAVSVGEDYSAAIGAAAAATRQLTGLAAGTADTDAVNVAQLKLARVEVKAGDNISVLTSYDLDGHLIYTISGMKGGAVDSDDRVVTLTPTIKMKSPSPARIFTSTDWTKQLPRITHKPKQTIPSP